MTAKRDGAERQRERERQRDRQRMRQKTLTTNCELMHPWLINASQDHFQIHCMPLPPSSYTFCCATHYTSVLTLNFLVSSIIFQRSLILTSVPPTYISYFLLQL